MKKMFALLTSALLIVSLFCGCGGPEKGYLTGVKMIDAYLELPIGASPDEAVKSVGELYEDPEEEDGRQHLTWLYEDQNGFAMFGAGFTSDGLYSKTVSLHNLRDRGFPSKKSVTLDKINELRNKMTLESSGAGSAKYKDGLPYKEVASILGCEGLITLSIFDESINKTVTTYAWLVEDHPSDLQISFYDDVLITIQV